MLSSRKSYARCTNELTGHRALLENRSFNASNLIPLRRSCSSRLAAGPKSCRSLDDVVFCFAQFFTKYLAEDCSYLRSSGGGLH